MKSVHLFSFVTKQERSLTKPEPAISCLTMITSVECLLYNIVCKSDSDNTHFRSETNQKQSVLVSLTACHNEDFYLKTGTSDETEIAPVDRLQWDTFVNPSPAE